ncbi:hypothetical protein XENOCAPTIV_027634 [Xenoophorus captivus]|uniref:Uncharacterized protein n=1 Tax=Xenoophorus captivus TaxID=1517983 RepID=A0ABV0R539_9TELE
MCKLKSSSEGAGMQKTGSQVLDSICISEAEKEAVLTLIREEVHTHVCLGFTRLHRSLTRFYSHTVSFQIITKEVETNDWKKKYEQCKQEVDEMRLENTLLKLHFVASHYRKIVAEYENTIAQMIGAYQSKLRNDGADRKPEEGADEERVSGTSSAAEGTTLIPRLCTRKRIIQHNFLCVITG